jgi:Concanavalin A-like lectin/glucanases superfamily
MHVALTSDGTTTKAYLDGVVIRNITGLSGNVSSSLSPLKIGARSATEVSLSPHNRFNGPIDEVAIYGRVLANAEIQAIRATSGAGLYKPCDANGGGIIRFDDVLAMISFLRRGKALLDNADSYPDGVVNFQDVVAILPAFRTP